MYANKCREINLCVSRMRTTEGARSLEQYRGSLGGSKSPLVAGACHFNSLLE